MNESSRPHTGPRNPAVDPWRALIGENADEATLTALCIASMPWCPESLNGEREGGFPSGRPAKKSVRKAAATLLALTQQPQDDSARTRRVLALLSSRYQPQESEPSPLGGSELDQRVRDCTLALRTSAMIADPAIELLTATMLCSALRNAGQPRTGAVVILQPVIDRIALTDEAGALLRRDAPFLPDFLAQRISSRSLRVLVRAYLDAQCVAEAAAVTDVLVAYTETYVDRIPGQHAIGLSLRANVARRRRDVRTFLAAEAQLKQLAEARPEISSIFREWNLAGGANAIRLNDHGRAWTLRLHRLHSRIHSDLGIEDFADTSVPPALDRLRYCLGRYRERGSKDGLTWMGNIAYDIQAGVIKSGRLRRDPAMRSYVLALLDLAEDAWSGYAVNGIYSIRFSRTRLLLVTGTPPTEELESELLAVQAGARLAQLSYNALHAAVRYGRPGSGIVHARIDALLSNPAPHTEILSAKLSGLAAEWWWRVIVSAGHTAHVSEVEAAAAAAIRRLRPAGVSIDPELEAIARCAAAWCRGVENDDRGRLVHLLAAIGCVAELMVTIGTDDDRRDLADRFGYLFADAATLATELHDDAAADLIMEAARRDRVGLILAELARNPDADVTVRATALEVSASSTASLDRPDDSDDEDPGDDLPSPSIDLKERSARVRADRAVARSSAEAVLGPLGALCDPTVLDTVRAERLIAAMPRAGAVVAVLQLLPLPDIENRPAPATVPVLRRLTYCSGSKSSATEYVDLIDVPRKLVTLAAGDRAIFDWRDTFAQALFPTPLRHLLDGATTDPLRLLIIPTGFFHVPFEALPTGPDTYLIDRAAVSVHGSLTSALALLGIELTPLPSPLLAVYDEARLEHANYEFQALNASIVPVTRVESATQLRQILTPDSTARISVLAMGVHGSTDQTGWGQAKLMPDGSEITATQMLALRVPSLCVLASCYSSVTTHDGVELGGFPLALMLRGAATVIGGLFNINDEATAQIMSRFWERMTNETAPVYALREAKLDWMAERPVRRANHHLWAGLVTYGCAHN